MLTTFDMDEYVYGGTAGRRQRVPAQGRQPELLVAGIRAVHAGESLLAPAVTRRMIEAFLGSGHGCWTPMRSEGWGALTAREHGGAAAVGPRADQCRDRRASCTSPRRR